MVGKMLNRTVRSVAVVMAAGVLMFGQAAIACDMPDMETSMPCCLEHCDAAVDESADCLEATTSAFAVDIRTSGGRPDQSLTESGDGAPLVAIPSEHPPDSPIRRRSLHWSEQWSAADGAASVSVYLLTRRIRI